MKRITILLFTLFLAAAGHAQVIVTLGSALLQNPGTAVHLPVSVKGLNGPAGGKGITGLEFHIAYNSGNLTYDTTLSFTPLMPAGQWFFGGNSLEYSTTWQEPSLQKVDLPDNTVLFDVVFQYSGGNTALTFDTARCFLIDSAYNIIPGVQYVNGQVTPSQGSGESRWNGTGSWNTASGWSNGIPGDSTAAVIETGTVTISSAAVAKSMSILAGSTVVIAPDFSLTVNRNFTNNGELRSESDATGTGSLIVSGTATGSGTNRFRRFLDTDGGTAHLVSSPVASVPGSLFSGLNAEKYLENTGTWAPFSSGETLNSGMGVRAGGTTVSTVTFEGNFPTGDITAGTLSYTESAPAETRGLNLAGNPYPSAIRLNQGNWARTNTDRAVYVWDGYKYLTWNGSFGSLSDGIIPAMQGFFFKSHAAGASVTIPAAARLHDTQPFHKEAGSVGDMISLRLEAGDAGSGSPFDEAFVHILAGTTGLFDAEEDAWKLQGSAQAPQIWTLAADQSRLAINTMATFETVSVELSTPSAGAWSIAFGNLGSFSSTQPLFFEDKTTGTVINIRNTPENKYVFASTGSTETGRFLLHFRETGLEETARRPFAAWSTGSDIRIVATGAEHLIRSVAIFSITGQQIFSSGTMETPASISRQAMPAGLYILRLETAGGFITEKIAVR